MDAEEKQRFIRAKAVENESDPGARKILWSRHGITELVEERLGRGALENGLKQCEVIEDYPTLHRPLPDCLVLGWITPPRPFHAVLAIDEANDRVLVVTVYRPSPEEWEDDCRTRRR
jgi:hypothetical protein